MAKHTTVAEIHENDQHNSSNRATYCPEDNKIRLYIGGDGRVERETYNYLRSNKWTATPKQSCSFVASWSPSAEDTALSLIEEGDEIGDEDYSPEERAADRAERFAGYRDKRTSEAHGHADTYEDGPVAFGNQNVHRAERQAARHERHRGRALCQWSKAEYWQQRTAGVISNALHRSDAATRRGRILTLEAEQRRATEGGRWHNHLTMRLIYENAMLENEGGQASEVEMIPGGFIGNRQIWKINRSLATGRVVSVAFSATGGPRNIERLGADVYRAPTPEELEAFNAAASTAKAARRAAAPAKPKLINPTLEAALRLCEIWNADRKGTDKASTPAVMTQAAYSERSKGEYGPCKTVAITERGLTYFSNYNGIEWNGHTAVCKIRIFTGGFDGINRPVVISDKPQKTLPFDQMTETGSNPPSRQAAAESLHMLNEVRRGKNWFKDMGPEVCTLWVKAAAWGFTTYSSESQFSITEAGQQILNSTPAPEPVAEEIETTEETPEEAPEPIEAAAQELVTAPAGCLF